MKTHKNNFAPGKDLIKILVVDDLEKVRGALRNLLNLKEGIEVIGEAKDGKEAVHLAETLEPDVVLMDWKMPNMDGLAAAYRIKDFSPEIGVILLTIHDTEELKQQPHHACIDEFAVKGIDADILIDMIRDVHKQKFKQKK